MSAEHDDDSPVVGSRTVHTRERNMAARWGCMSALGLFVLICLMCNGLLGMTLAITDPGVFLTANVLALLTAVPYCALLLWLDRNESEPIWLITIALLWGAVVATVVSGLVNDSFSTFATALTGNELAAEFLAASISAPFIEELSKGMAVLFIFLLFREEFDNVLDGILYGALVGLGFATVENVLYYFEAGTTVGYGEMLGLTWARGVIGGICSHATFTAIIGCGFGLVRVLRKGWARWLIVPAMWVLGMGAHFAWNTFAGFILTSLSMVSGVQSMGAMYVLFVPIAALILQVPFVLLLLTVVIFVWRHENRIILYFLKDEPEDVITEEQRLQMVPARRRAARGAARFFSRGPGRWWHQRRLHRDLIELAFLKWHHHVDEETTWAADQDSDVLALRDKVRARRRMLTG
jgi:protease PrsW